MQNPNGIRVLFLLSPVAFLLPFATLVFILERISQTLLNTQLHGGSRRITLYGPTNSSSDAVNTSTDVLLSIDYGPTLAILGISVFAFIVGVLAACGIWELRRVEGSPGIQRFWAWTALVANVVVVGLCVGVLAWASVVQNGQGWKGYEDVGVYGQRYTRETWVCQIDKFYPQQDWAGPACGLAKATRFMLIPLALSAILVMVSAGILTRDRGGAKWLFGGRGRYGGFASVYEMNLHGPAPPYPPGPQFFPMPQQYPGPQQYQMPQPYPYPAQPQPAHPPAQFQSTPQAPKGAATAGERAVFS
ncbi:hypothetical protein K458DRAFT_446691 [Lentithecium fluviatile CBS 122367]|uniref:Uncharacterized protein n=1 Tax=Lentithecium fluviatile CBS 122367 TaxID=1168545 RepID=A0A6G1IJ00_9PLEO|nr:hypothetical protein K458DRAFT_446691 [Lentithecium fluviatile CBS 122367]